MFSGTWWKAFSANLSILQFFEGLRGRLTSLCPLTSDELLLFLFLRLHWHPVLLPDVPIDTQMLSWNPVSPGHLTLLDSDSDVIAKYILITCGPTTPLIPGAVPAWKETATAETTPPDVCSGLLGNHMSLFSAEDENRDENRFNTPGNNLRFF